MRSRKISRRSHQIRKVSLAAVHIFQGLRSKANLFGRKWLLFSPNRSKNDRPTIFNFPYQVALDLMKPLLLENKVPAMLLAAECHLRMSEPTPISEQFDRIEALHLITPRLVRGTNGFRMVTSPISWPSCMSLSRPCRTLHQEVRQESTSRRALRVPAPCAPFRCILAKGLNLQGEEQGLGLLSGSVSGPACNRDTSRQLEKNNRRNRRHPRVSNIAHRLLRKYYQTFRRFTEAS